MTKMTPLFALAAVFAAALPGAAQAGAACTPCLQFYDVSAGFHRFVGAQEVRRCGSSSKPVGQHVYGFVDDSDRAIFARVLSGNPGFDTAIPIGEACGKRKVAQVKRDLQRLTDEASARYGNPGYTVARQAATPLLNTACAEEAERVRLKLSSLGVGSAPPVLESPLNLGQGALPPPPPPP
jgi:hypothetical protein